MTISSSVLGFRVVLLRQLCRDVLTFSSQQRWTRHELPLRDIVEDYRWQSSSALMRHRCQVSVDEGCKWAKECRIKLGKDKSYSLFGIFNVQMPLLCDEGIQEP